MSGDQQSVQDTPMPVPIASPVSRKRVTLRYDSTYIRKKSGIAKVAQILFSFLGFICIQCTYLSLHSNGKWFSTVSMLGVWITAILLFCYVFHFVEKFTNIPWAKFEFFYCLIIALCYLMASLMALTMEIDAFHAAAFFGFCATLLYALDAYAKYGIVKSGNPAQGEPIVDVEAPTEVSAAKVKKSGK